LIAADYYVSKKRSYLLKKLIKQGLHFEKKKSTYPGKSYLIPNFSSSNLFFDSFLSRDFTSLTISSGVLA